MNIPKIKFSNMYAKGSCSERTNTALRLNEQLFSKIYSLYKDTDYVSIREIERTYKKFLPEPIYFSVKKLKPEELKKYWGALISYYDGNNKVSKYRMVLAAEKNKLCVSNLPTLMHESMHLFDYLLRPKYLHSSEQIRRKNLKTVVQDLCANQYYNNKGYADFLTNRITLKRTKNETEKALKELSTEEKLAVLNNIKSYILTEINAFGETQKYAKILQKDKRHYQWIDADGYFKSYMFEKKLDIVNSMIYRIIQKERSRFPQKFSVKCVQNLIKTIKSMVFIPER